MHHLRHSCATLLLAQGINPRVVMETLGHSQISLMLNTYGRVLPELHRDIRTTQRYMHLSPSAVDSAIALLDARGGLREIAEAAGVEHVGEPEGRSHLPDHGAETRPNEVRDSIFGVSTIRRLAGSCGVSACLAAVSDKILSPQ